MNSKSLSYLVLSDIHLGHRRNKTEFIIHNLREYFKDYHTQIKKCRIIFIAGDIFDTLLTTHGDDYLKATEWITELILYCQHNKIKLRILEGTPSHDWRQAKLISQIIDKLNIDINYKYISTLYIENMVDEGINILYVPDEYKPKASDTYKEVLELLKNNGLTQVDIAIMHGQFNYQLPLILESSHVEEDYLSIVKYFINIGHIHTPSIYKGTILAQGSFDRLAHNEEEDKGGMLCTITPDSKSFLFLKKKRAMIFKTFNYLNTTLTQEEIIRDLDLELSKLPDNSHVRIIIDKSEFLNDLKNKYSNIHFKIQSTRETNSMSTGEDILKDAVIESFTITKDNISELLHEELNKYNLTSKELTIVDEELGKVI